MESQINKYRKKIINYVHKHIDFVLGFIVGLFLGLFLGTITLVQVIIFEIFSFVSSI